MLNLSTGKCIVHCIPRAAKRRGQNDAPLCLSGELCSSADALGKLLLQQFCTLLGDPGTERGKKKMSHWGLRGKYLTDVQP